MRRRRLILGIALNYLFFSVLLFLPAGTLAWGRAWLFLGLYTTGTFAAMRKLFPSREELLEERFKPLIQKGQPLADKIILPLFVAAYSGSVAFSSFDVFHLRLLGKPGGFVSFCGLALFAAGWRIVFFALWQNAFAASVVRHQVERGHKVVDTGLYGIVRHPMYAGGVLLMLGLPLWLESYAGALSAVLPAGLLVLRIRFEEDFLKRELPGYEAYTRKVRHRLIPRVW
ncbi:MAG: isoprenylcysteine carboxylmethyltransferase family protein [Desulfobacteraceae bacterium]|nr:isoprenylcysteine carboxylmethyltransferase family protein [Desulfobacteraceae bacterium]